MNEAIGFQRPISQVGNSLSGPQLLRCDISRSFVLRGKALHNHAPRDVQSRFADALVAGAA